jgi:predicted permease
VTSGDFWYALRAIRRSPLVALVVISSLGVGIGVNTIVFSWIQAVVFKPIPGVANASAFHLIEPRTDNGVYPGTSWPEFRDLRERLQSFEGITAFRMTPLYVGKSGEVERAYALLVSDNYFSVLGLTPAAGRFLRAEEVSRPGGEPVAVVSHDYALTRYGGPAEAIGRTLRANGVDLAIVGVAPPGFLGTMLRLEFDMWVPATLAPALLPGSRELDQRGVRGYTITGRLRPSSTTAHAQSEVDAVLRQLASDYPGTNAAIQAEVLPYWRSSRGPQRFLAPALGFLQGVMLLLLLAVCGNTANLALSRASARQREMGMRLALGAGRWRILSLVLTENILLAIAGAGLGAAIAWWGTRALTAVPLTVGFPVSLETHIDIYGIVFALGLGVACGVAFGLVPGLQLSRVDPQCAFRTGALTQGRSAFRHVLMGVQVALALLVLVAAGFFIRQFLETRDIDPGFRRDGVLLAAYDLTGRTTGEAASRTFASRLLARLRDTPAVEAAAISSAIPLDIHGLPSRVFTVEGWTRPDEGFDLTLVNTVTPGYLALMDIALTAGTDFASLDDVASPPQAIVNEAFARRYLDRLEPLGRRLDIRGRTYVIVGVARTSTYNTFGEAPTPIVHLSYRDAPGRAGEIHVRARAGSEKVLAAAVRDAVRTLDADLPIYNVRTLTDHVENNLIFRRIPARMFAVLGPLLLVLASMGIYAVSAYNVSLRATEIGVRQALGATRARVVAYVVGETLGIILLGVAAGWLLAFVLVNNLLGAPIDPAEFGAVPALLVAVAAFASWIPARRAARLDLWTALRQE